MTKYTTKLIRRHDEIDKIHNENDRRHDENDQDTTKMIKAR
ncbi:hypothetical protein [Sesame phyllody phytoplasma]|nr:hypothetical protein [Sesame phyllody phytoplasma]